MRTLLLQLPLTPPGPSAPNALYGHAWIDTANSAAPLHRNDAPLALVPARDKRDVVAAIVPAAALSWQRVTLPAGLGRQGPKLQAALQGLLEDQLLQDIGQVHLALPPVWQSGEPLWVAVCDKAWLQQQLQALDEAQMAVQRLLPEWVPPTQGETWHATGDEHQGSLWCCSADSGVSAWPVAAAAQLPSAWLEGATVQVEPALASWAQARFPDQVQLVEAASHWRSALDSGWDLAQFGLADRLRQRRWLRWRQRLDSWWHQPRWRPARWGLLALVLTQLIGLNAWAWVTRQQWESQQAAWTHILQSSFPQVHVVLDAPLQMAREVARLRQGSGQLGPSDFESLLQALGSALPPGTTSPTQLRYQDGVLHWPALPLDAAGQHALEQALQQQGYALQKEGAQWQLQAREARP